MTKKNTTINDQGQLEWEKQDRLKKKMMVLRTVRGAHIETQDNSADNRAGRAKRAKQDTPESGNE